jgi:hypothetical protein
MKNKRKKPPKKTPNPPRSSLLDDNIPKNGGFDEEYEKKPAD